MIEDDLLGPWERAQVGRAITHEEHVRLVLALLRDNPVEEAERRVVAATRRNCEAQGAPEKFDEALTRAWVRRIDQAAHAISWTYSEQVLSLHPELLDSRLLGPPAWRLRAPSDDGGKRLGASR